MLTNYGRLAIAELVFYCPLLLVVIWIGKRCGFDRRTAWIYLLFLALIRIVGGALQLQSEKAPTKALITVAAIASSVGIAPLELFMNWHLKRMISGMIGNSVISRHTFTVVYVGIVIAVVLAIVGGATATYSPIVFHAKLESKVAIVILIALFTVLVVVNVLLLFRLRYLSQGERLPLLAITAGSPFLASRLAYACTSAYRVSQTFNPLVGNIWVLAFMCVFEEFMVALLYSFASIKTPLMKGTSKESPKEPSTLDFPRTNTSSGSTTTDKKSQYSVGESGRQGITVKIEKPEVELDGVQKIVSDVGNHTRDVFYKQKQTGLGGKQKAVLEPDNAGLETKVCLVRD